MQPSRQGQPSPKYQLLLQVSRSNTNSAYYVDIEDHNIDHYNYCDPTGSDNLDDNSRSNDGRILTKAGRPKKVKAVPPSPAAVTPMSSHFSLYGNGRWVGRGRGWRWRDPHEREEEAMGVECGGAAEIARFNGD